MRKKALILIGIWSACIAAWTLANPPAGTPGTTKGGITADTAGNIGIKTEVPASALDVNGTTTIRKSLDMQNNLILNVAAPITDLDAANKAYVDAAQASVSSSTMRIWGEGRPGIAVVNGAGECTRTIGGSDVKISRSSRPVSWDGSTAACPTGWWVCTASERGSGVCGSGNRNGVMCDIPQAGFDELYAMTNTWGWVADTGVTDNREYGAVILAGGGATQTQYACALMPAWCCAYQ